MWYALILAAGVLAFYSLGTLWAIPAFLLYGTLYGGPADSRWHEAGHGTAFKTRWINDLVYQLASFQVMRRRSSARASGSIWAGGLAAPVTLEARPGSDNRRSSFSA